MNTDTEVILNALQKERDELHDRIMQVDRIIKRVKSLEYSASDTSQDSVKQLPVEGSSESAKAFNIFPRIVDIKIQVLRVFDLIKLAAKLKDIQTEYTKISGNKYNIRETVHQSVLFMLFHKAKIK